MSEPKQHDLYKFMQAIKQEIAAEYERIRMRTTEDPGTAGDQGEENWADLFRDWLPPTLHVATKGRILGHEGEASSQVDVLVLHPSYPRKLRNKKLYLAGGVLAAFECKNTLKAEHVSQAVKTAVQIRGLLPQRHGTPYKELHSPIIYGLLAHSYSWKSESSTPIENITEALKQADEAFVKHPREMLDFICVSDLATWSSSRSAWHGPQYWDFWDDLMTELYGAKGSPTSSHPCYSSSTQARTKVGDSFTPVGTMLSLLLRKLAKEDDSFSRLSTYFSAAKVTGAGRGVERVYPASIYSKEVKEGIINGALRITEKELSPEEEEWRIGF